MPRRKKDPYLPPEPWTDIQHEVDGKVYKGRYQVDDGTLTVVLAGHRVEPRRTWVGRSTHVESLAGILLAELIVKLQRSVTE